MSLNSTESPYPDQPLFVPRLRFDWRTLVAIEPQLHALIRKASFDGMEFEPGTYARHRAWADLKRTLRELVGWRSRNPALRSSDAYDVAYRHVLEAFELGGRR